MEPDVVPLKEAYLQIGRYVRDALHGGRPTVITAYGKPAAMVVPVPADLRAHLILLDLTAEVIDGGPDWREDALTAWLEAAAESGYGFSLIDTDDLPPAPGKDEPLAVIERDHWVGDEWAPGGPRYLLVLHWPPDLDPALRGQAGGVEVRCIPHPS